MRAIFFGLVAAALPLHATALELTLRCEGTARMAALRPGVLGTMTGPSGEQSTFNVGGGVGLERSSERVRVEITDDRGRINMPSGARSVWSSAGADGWWPLYDIQVSEQEIRARFKRDVFTKPTVRIDRISGDIDVKGTGADFTGTCAPEDRDTANRKF